MPTNSKAVLIGLNIYLSENNIKRNIGSFVTNVANSNGDIKTVNTLVLLGGGTYSYAATAGNLITIAKCSEPLTIDVTLAGGGTFTKLMTSILLLDMEVSTIVFTNNSATDNVNLVIISG
jgi:hypothetical protein